MTTTDAPDPRARAAAVWTGQELFVWGGQDPAFSPVEGGARYDPALDRWRALPAAPIDSLGGPAAVWTGTEVFVMDDGAALFDPQADAWTEASSMGRPEARFLSHVVWTGTEVLVWGGGVFDQNGNLSGVGSGARYDPATDSWTAMSTAGAPAARYAAVTAWTGTEMLIWGGLDEGTPTEFADGARYNPTTNTWQPMSNVGAPSRRLTASSAWTGSELVVWGGIAVIGGISVRGDGAVYDPSNDRWRPLATTTGAPSPRWGAAAAWSGSEFVLWGGASGLQSSYQADGARVLP